MNCATTCTLISLSLLVDIASPPKETGMITGTLKLHGKLNLSAYWFYGHYLDNVLGIIFNSIKIKFLSKHSLISLYAAKLVCAQFYTHHLVSVLGGPFLQLYQYNVNIFPFVLIYCWIWWRELLYIWRKEKVFSITFYSPSTAARLFRRSPSCVQLAHTVRAVNKQLNCSDLGWKINT